VFTVLAAMCSLFGPMCSVSAPMCSLCRPMCSVGVDDAFAPAASARRFPGGLGVEIRQGLSAEAVGLSAGWTVGCCGVTRG